MTVMYRYKDEHGDYKLRAINAEYIDIDWFNGHFMILHDDMEYFDSAHKLWIDGKEITKKDVLGDANEN